MTNLKRTFAVLATLAIVAMPVAAAHAEGRDGVKHSETPKKVEFMNKANIEHSWTESENSKAHLKTIVGNVTAVSGTTLTIQTIQDTDNDSDEGDASSTPSTASTTASTIFTVDASHAKFFGDGKILDSVINLSNIKVGDKVQAKGTLTGTNLVAQFIRDLTFRKTIREITGIVATTTPATASSSASFTLNTSNHGTQTVNVASSTVVKLANNQTGSISNIVSGATVRVIGFWDKVANVINALLIRIK